MRIENVSLSGNIDRPTLLAEEDRNGFPASPAPLRRKRQTS